MMEWIIGLVIYLFVGWFVANFIDTEDILDNALVMLFWPLAVVLAFFCAYFLGVEV